MDNKTALFIEKAKSVHGNTYDYSKTIYINRRTLLTIICHKHGAFEQNPQTHLNGCGCKKCSGKYKHSTSDFINVASVKHNNKYDYTKVNYINSKQKVCIICPQHGEFWQTPNDHLDGCGCPICGGKQKITTKDIIQRCIDSHGDVYDYSKVEYKDCRTKICIICPEHGEFWQKPSNHIDLHQGCPKCKKLSKGQSELFKQIKNAFPEEEVCWEYTAPWLEKLKIDIYLPKYKLAIEYDGIQHNKIIKWFGDNDGFISRKERDTRKEQLCKNNNVTLYRVSYDVTFKSFSKVLDYIKSFIEHGRLSET